MKNYLADFTGTKEARATWDKLDEATRKQREREGISAWHKWMQDHAADLVETGSPLGKTMDATLAFWRQVAGYGRQAMANAERGERVDDSNWKTVLAWYQAGQMMPFELEDTTFLEMRDNGDLNLVADERLRSRVAEYYRLTATGTTRAKILSHDPEYRRQIRGLTPWSVQQYIWDKCFRQLEGVRQELIDCPAPISEDESAALLEVYRTTPGLLENLRFWVATLRVSEIVIGINRTEADALARDVGNARRG
jgi:hypothetical protein